MFIFWKVKSLKELIIGFLGEIEEELCTGCIPSQYTLTLIQCSHSHEQLKCRQLTSYQPSSYCLYIHRHVSVGVNVVGAGCDLSSSRNV